MNAGRQSDIDGLALDPPSRLPEANQPKERLLFVPDVIAWHNHSKLRCKACGKACLNWAPPGYPNHNHPDVWTLQRKVNVLFHQPSNICGVVCERCNNSTSANEAKKREAHMAVTAEGLEPLEQIEQRYAGHGGPAAHAAENPLTNDLAHFCIESPMAKLSGRQQLPITERKRQLRPCFMFMMMHPPNLGTTAKRVTGATISHKIINAEWRKFTKWKNNDAITEQDIDRYISTIEIYRNVPTV